MTKTRDLIAKLIDDAIAGAPTANSASTAVQAVVVSKLTEGSARAPFRVEVTWQSRYNGVSVSVDGCMLDLHPRRVKKCAFEEPDEEAAFRAKYPDADQWLVKVGAAWIELLRMRLDPRGTDGSEEANAVFSKHLGKVPDKFTEDEYSS